VPRFVSVTVALVALLALLSSGSYVLARWYDWAKLAEVSGLALEGSLVLIGLCCAYACAVGVYHTFLSVTGLDEEREDTPS
jgi:hypothetical protein